MEKWHVNIASGMVRDTANIPNFKGIWQVLGKDRCRAEYGEAAGK